MSKLHLNRAQTLSDLVVFPLLKSNEKAVIDESEKYVLANDLKDIFLFDDKTFIGVEVEVEGVTETLPSLLPFWTFKEDGSLRNQGIEFVSTPVRGKGLIAALHKVSSLLKDTLPAHDFSERTSIHVHVNVRDMTFEGLINFLLIYLIFESALYKTIFDVCGRKRDENIFCVPIQDTGKSVFSSEVLSKFERGKNADALRTLVEYWRKYSGLNVVPVSSFGTIEFRHLGGVQDYMKILEWINMILSMKEYASIHPYEGLKERIMELNTNSMYEVFTKDVFSRLANNVLKYNIKDELEKGVIFVKYLFTESSRTPLNRDKFEGSSMKALLEKSLGKELKPQKKEEQKKRPEEMTEKELEIAYLDAAQKVVELELEYNTVAHAVMNSNTREEQQVFRHKAEFVEGQRSVAVEYKMRLLEELSTRKENTDA